MRWITSILLVPVFLSSGYPDTIIVDPSGGGNYKDIQSAINASREGDTILVDAGEYVITEPLTFQGKAIAIRAESGIGKTVLRMDEAPKDPTRSSVVVFESGENSASILMGFKVTGGRGTGKSPFSSLGGGILCRNGSSPTIDHCLIEENFADRGGGAHVANGCLPMFFDCIFRNNTASSGAGILADGEVVIIRTVFSGNSAIDLGGGAAFFEGATVENSLFSGNVANAGGGIIAQWKFLSCRHCTFHGNRARGLGGGIANGVENRATIGNCLFWGNEAPVGRAIVVSDDHGGGSTAIRFCLVEGGPEGVELYAGNPPQWGEGNLAKNPLFVDPGHWEDGGTPAEPSDDTWIDGDYHLLPGSPAIDAGASEGAPEVDIELNGRPCDEGVDIGSYEYCGPSEAPFRRGDADGNGTLNLTDVIRALTYQFVGGITLECQDAADVDDDGELTLTDAIRSLNYQFTGTASMPEPPGPLTCGPDVNDDAFPPCEYTTESCQ